LLRERSAASPDVITTSKIAKAIKEEDVLMLFPALRPSDPHEAVATVAAEAEEKGHA